MSVDQYPKEKTNNSSDQNNTEDPNKTGIKGGQSSQTNTNDERGEEYPTRSDIEDEDNI